MHILPYLVILSTLFLGPYRGHAAGLSGPHGDPTVLLRGCSSCHVGHGVPGTAMLPLAEESFCYQCHGNPARISEMHAQKLLRPGIFPADVEAVFRKPSRHPVERKGQHRSGESWDGADLRHAECADCHNHHRVDEYRKVTSSPLKKSTLTVVDTQAELCFRCHGDKSPLGRDVEREFSLTSRSSHPVLSGSTPGTAVPGLTSAARAGKAMACTDCHNNSDAQGPRGPHGSDYFPLLKAAYEQTSGVESPGRYALCYTCHERNTLLFGSNFPEHTRHMRDGKNSCAECHNAHGSPTNRALVEFKAGSDIRPASNGRLEFSSQSVGSGQCSVRCHGVDHINKRY